MDHQSWAAGDLDGRPRIAVVGTGYVGLTAAACLASLDNSVIAIDVDAEKIAALERGEVPIVEAGIESLVSRGVASGRLSFSSRYDAVASADIVLLCLPTPYLAGAGLDLSAVREAALDLRRLVKAGTIVVAKSTVPVGTHRELANWLDRADVHVASNPEFLREGSAIEDFLEPDRIVIGAGDARVGRAVARIYDGIAAPIQITDPTSAELIKAAANTFLATKLGLINEISRLCDRLGADIDAVATGIGSDQRIGPAFIQPGPGWGGSCFGKDTRGLAASGRAVDCPMPITEAAFASNTAHIDHITEEITRLCPRPLPDARIALWGATFKAGTDDVRESPAIEIASRLIHRGATVVVYDPAAPPSLVPAETADDPFSACNDADLLVVATEWPEFGRADLDKVAGLMRGRVVYDTRAVIEPAAAVAADLRLIQMGRGARPESVRGPTTSVQ